ncbi:DUF6090 family protein [Hyphococcus sp.]|uniref:DUF6090 family protein n=1 Tax=Hyphococcus sp. TaxID=2038636 RepID=UPI0035C76667
MLLRRVIEHVKAQNWTAVALDFIIVVVGVFIGIQVSNWNAAQINAARQETLLRELTADLRADIEELDATLEVTRLRFNAAETLVARASGWRVPNEYPTGFGTSGGMTQIEREAPEAPKDAVYFAQRYVGFDISRRSFDALIADGDFTFAGRPGLASKLRSHYAYAEIWIDAEDGRQLAVSRELQKAFLRVGFSIFEDPDWEELDALVASNPELAGALKATAWEAVIQNIVLRQIRADTEALIKEIEEDDK